MKDLLENRELREIFRQDAQLSVDDFADRHQHTVRAHYLRGGYRAPDPEEAYQIAADLWGILRRGL